MRTHTFRYANDADFMNKLTDQFVFAFKLD